jgi:dTDP-4-dehydrorhamnose 3,5-epimerase
MGILRDTIPMKRPPITQMPPSYEEGSIEGVMCRSINSHIDPRGWLMEIYRQDELPVEFHPVMAYVSETLPDVVRGPHEHRYQADNFAFVGPGDFYLYLWDIRAESPTYGKRMKCLVGQSNRATVLVPPGVVHAYKNVSEVSGWVINLPNQLYAGEGRKENVDEIRYENDLSTSFHLY